ncbi:hypothetical protein [Gulosibacter molinativorax]|uniref:hypothetical protein n=1 Tax=Gulosibacter molinativorax TaxID=256821 RepID=UPI0011B1C6B1|nr:hypothetical protein [Gulosibacter molinativorax]QUY61859.1 Hypotetical protein [Gulosibacter molinativorax]
MPLENSQTSSEFRRVLSKLHDMYGLEAGNCDLFVLDNGYPAIAYAGSDNSIYAIYLAPWTDRYCALRFTVDEWQLGHIWPEQVVTRLAADIATALQEPWGSVSPREVQGILWSGDVYRDEAFLENLPPRAFIDQIEAWARSAPNE